VIKQNRIKQADYAAGAEIQKTHSKLFIAKLEGKRTFWRHRCTQENNIKMSLKVTGLENTGWANLLRTWLL
jgi:hypothetical protein